MYAITRNHISETSICSFDSMHFEYFLRSCYGLILCFVSLHHFALFILRKQTIYESDPIFNRIIIHSRCFLESFGKDDRWMFLNKFAQSCKYVVRLSLFSPLLSVFLRLYYRMTRLSSIFIRFKLLLWNINAIYITWFECLQPPESAWLMRFNAICATTTACCCSCINYCSFAFQGRCHCHRYCYY